MLRGWKEIYSLDVKEWILYMCYDIIVIIIIWNFGSILKMSRWTNIFF